MLNSRMYSDYKGNGEITAVFLFCVVKLKTNFSQYIGVTHTHIQIYKQHRYKHTQIDVFSQLKCSSTHQHTRRLEDLL